MPGHMKGKRDHQSVRLHCLFPDSKANTHFQIMQLQQRRCLASPAKADPVTDISHDLDETNHLGRDILSFSMLCAG